MTIKKSLSEIISLRKENLSLRNENLRLKIKNERLENENQLSAKRKGRNGSSSINILGISLHWLFCPRFLYGFWKK